MGEVAADAQRGKRLHHVLGVIARDGADAVRLPSDSNDAWRLGDAVLRICYRGDRTRFEREALVTTELPASAKVPRLLEYGGDDELAWQVTAWVDGVTLGAAWPTLHADGRRRAITQLGEALAELNGYPLPPVVGAALAAPRPVGKVSSDAVVGADLNPLPVPRARLLLEPAARLPGVDRSLIDRVAARFDELETIDPLGERALAERGPGAVVHGDAHPMNVLWDEGVVAILDWEWVRLGAPELEIEPFLYRGYESDPRLMVDSRRIIGWLAKRILLPLPVPIWRVGCGSLSWHTRCDTCCCGHLTAPSISFQRSIHYAGCAGLRRAVSTSSGYCRVPDPTTGTGPCRRSNRDRLCSPLSDGQRVSCDLCYRY